MPCRLPNFLFIGPDKSGSTWLYEALKRHSQVFLPRVKELFFFDQFYDKGWRWYGDYFRDAGEQHRVVGEVCHDYLFSRLACQRIALDLPSAKLMVCLREPSQRAFSEYLYRIRIGLLACDFETALRKDDGLIDHGCYAKHLRYYLEHFRRDQIYVAVFDDLVADPQRFFDGICDFLGLEHTALSSERKQKVLSAARPRFPQVTKIGRWMGSEFRRWGLPGVVAQVKESALFNRFFFIPYGSLEKPEMSLRAREYLRAVFSPELRKLDALLGAKFCARWGYPKEA